MSQPSRIRRLLGSLVVSIPTMVRLYAWWCKRHCAALVTLEEAPSLPRVHEPTQYAMASHDPIEHRFGEPCIHFKRVTEPQTIPVIVIESIHHALLELEGQGVDNAWEYFHGIYSRAKQLLDLDEC